MKSRLEDMDIQTKEILFNEQFVCGLGHSLDSFTTLLLKEGIPQLPSQDQRCGEETIKLCLEHYFDLGSEGVKSPVFQFPIFMKSGYIRHLEVQTYFFRNYEAGKFGMDTAIVSKTFDEPYLDNNIRPKKVFNKEFLEGVIEKEKNLSEFLSNFYNSSLPSEYLNTNKVCRIRELETTNEMSE